MVKILNAPEKKSRLLRVAGYARVSTELESQESSAELQIRTLRDQITANPSWEFVGVFVDDGITGTSVDKRLNMMELIKACEAGKVDRIITKSLSRFSRNTLDSLGIIRKLQGLGVSIHFQKENIDTAAAYSEMLLTILAAFAQQESKSISQNVTWGIRKRFEQGKARWARLYGYTKEGDREYIIVPSEAEVVRRVFDEAERNRSLKQIADGLNKDKITTSSGNAWSSTVLNKMLHNERYTGDILLQKTITENFLTHKAVKNDASVVPSYHVEGHHEGIIDKEQFERVGRILEMNKTSCGNPIQYPFGEIVRCPYCGKAMTQRKLWFSGLGRAWICEENVKEADEAGNKACEKLPHFIIRSGHVEDAAVKAYNELKIKGKAAERAWKAKNPTVETAEYYWIDRMIESVSFGKHEDFIRQDIPRTQFREVKGNRKDFTVTIHWKWGQESTVDSGIERLKDVPAILCDNCRETNERRNTPVSETPRKMKINKIAK